MCQLFQRLALKKKQRENRVFALRRATGAGCPVSGINLAAQGCANFFSASR